EPAPRTVLDFDCGDGSVLMAAAEAGIECVGIEYQPSAVESSSARTGLPVLDSAELKSGGDRFDVVHLSDVLGHLTDPYATLRKLERHLAPGGRLMIDGPLERNRSLVFWVAATSKRVRRAIGRRTVPEAPPTMLLRTDLAAQRRFIAERLGYRELVLRVYETGWPYLAPAGAAATVAGR